MRSIKLFMALCSVAVVAAPAATMAAEKAPTVIAAPAAGKGQVVFYRTGGLMGAAIACNVREDGKLIGGLSGGKYFVANFTPGKHVLTTKSEATDTLNMEIESGETYYVRCTIGAGVMAGRPNLSPVDKAAFDEKSSKLKLKTADQLKQEADKDAKKKAK
ncbi:MAG: DUF2846 domain-containing protein [Sphingopyxis sp.]|nr:DUF2846 domain-containing protein [Sphingopyxis sp.]